MHGGCDSRTKTRVCGRTSATTVTTAATAAAAEASSAPTATAAPDFIAHCVCQQSPPPTRLLIRISALRLLSKRLVVAETRTAG